VVENLQSVFTGPGPGHPVTHLLQNETLNPRDTVIVLYDENMPPLAAEIPPASVPPNGILMNAFELSG